MGLGGARGYARGVLTYPLRTFFRCVGRGFIMATGSPIVFSTCRRGTGVPWKKTYKDGPSRAGMAPWMLASMCGLAMCECVFGEVDSWAALPLPSMPLPWPFIHHSFTFWPTWDGRWVACAVTVLLARTIGDGLGMAVTPMSPPRPHAPPKPNKPLGRNPGGSFVWGYPGVYNPPPVAPSNEEAKALRCYMC